MNETNHDDRRGASIRASQHGLYPDSNEDATPLIKQILGKVENGQTLVLEPGEYHFWPHQAEEKFYYLSNNQAGLKRIAFPLLGRRGITIDGAGARLVFHGEILPFVVDHGSNIRLKNFTIDWHRTFFSQGEILAAGMDHVDVAIDEARYPYEVVDGTMRFIGEGWSHGFTEGIFEFDARLRRPAHLSGDNLGGVFSSENSAEYLGDSRVRLKGEFGRLARPGNILVMRHYRRYFPAVFMVDSKDVVLESLVIRHAAGTAVLGQFTENISLLNCAVEPDEASGRYFSSTADATHFVNCRGKILFRRCRMSNQLDDAANVHGIHFRVDEREGDCSLLLGIGHFEQKSMRPGVAGDDVVFRHANSLATLGKGRIKRIEQVDEWTFRVIFRAPLSPEIQPGCAMENLTWTPEVVIEGCRVQNNRARGFLLSTPRKIIVRENELSPAGSAIKISGDASYWFESGAVRDVLIEDNHFGECCYGPVSWGRAVIDIDPEVSGPDVAEATFHSGICITNNIFSTFDTGLVYARSVKGFVFKGNRIEANRAYRPDKRMRARLTLEVCKDVCVQDNYIATDVAEAPMLELNETLNERHHVELQPHLDTTPQAHVESL
ncbi:hypothetical protein H5P28_04195 [Ruficoccus amylovorans]|uniref:Right-handed parallel beta-helix repeat-containing protein n=1 Tax=Ruficoccus amylovorans TaxID=1804625 RepID=A0A842HAR8_9BACT|nr:hypothetical protein [Ruficoccus amylovorans]MBC2593455.1 hypothetical protein [Ruficoccus amylovorans]